MNDDDAARFAVIDALKVRPRAGRLSDKRTDAGAKRYMRQTHTFYLMLPACGCQHAVRKPGTICPICGGAELIDEERARR